MTPAAAAAVARLRAHLAGSAEVVVVAAGPAAAVVLVRPAGVATEAAAVADLAALLAPRPPLRAIEAPFLLTVGVTADGDEFKRLGLDVFADLLA